MFRPTTLPASSPSRSCNPYSSPLSVHSAPGARSDRVEAAKFLPFILATRHSITLSPQGSLAPASLSPFPAALTDDLQPTENPATLNPLLATLTRRVTRNSCVCRFYKKHPRRVPAIASFFVAQTSVCAFLSLSASQRSQAKDPHELKNLAVLPVTSLPRPCRDHKSPVTASVRTLPPVTSHESQVTNTISFIIRTYIKSAHKLFRMNTYKTQGLKPFRMNTYKKTGEGDPLPTGIDRAHP